MGRGDAGWWWVRGAGGDWGVCSAVLEVDCLQEQSCKLPASEWTDLTQPRPAGPRDDQHHDRPQRRGRGQPAPGAQVHSPATGFAGIEHSGPPPAAPRAPRRAGVIRDEAGALATALARCHSTALVLAAQAVTVDCRPIRRAISRPAWPGVGRGQGARGQWRRGLLLRCALRLRGPETISRERNVIWIQIN